MSELVSRSLAAWAYWRLAVVEFLFASVRPLFSAIVLALDEKDWNTLTTQGKFITILMVLGIWSDKVEPIIKEAMKKLRTDAPLDETTFTPRDQPPEPPAQPHIKIG
jgi:hypothetical protein